MSTHVPPFLQGLDAHSSISTLHLGPGGTDVNTQSKHVPIGIDFLNFDLTLSLSESLTSEARFANTVVVVDAIFADTVVTWVTGTVVKVDLTVCACVHKEELGV